MRRIFFITMLLLGAVILQYRNTEAQTSPTLNTITGPYRGPNAFVTQATLRDSINALEARLHLVIIDTTAATNDSIALIRASIAALTARYVADSAAISDSLRALREPLDSLTVVWQTSGGIDGAEVTTSNHVTFTVLPSASLAVAPDTSNLIPAWFAWALRDTINYIWVTAGETTSPGLFYAADTSTGKYVKADTLRTVRALGVALDSVDADGVVRLQTTGTVSFSWWNGLLGVVGSTVVNDSMVAGRPAPADAARTNTKKMQPLGTVLDSVTIRLGIGEVWYYEN